MKRKIIGISIILLLLAIIPTTSIATVTPTPSVIKYEGRIWLRGLVKVAEIENETVHADAIILHFIVWNNTIYRLTIGVAFCNVTFPDSYFMIPIGKFSYVLGISTGELVLGE